MGVDTADSSTDHKVRPSESKFHTMIPSAIVSDSVPHSSQPLSVDSGSTAFQPEAEEIQEFHSAF